MDMCVIFQLIMIVLMLIIFWIFIAAIHPRQSVVAKIVFWTSTRNFFIQIALFKETILLVCT